jgi:hypothetical protein
MRLNSIYTNIWCKRAPSKSECCYDSGEGINKDERSATTTITTRMN